MQIHIGIDNLKINGCVATIGMFDGVHKGHQQLISELVQIAHQQKLQSVVLTLWPHPKTILSNGRAKVNLLSTLDEKAEIIATLGVDHLVVMEFNKRVSQLTPTRFIRDILINKLHVRHLHMGFNHHFGAGNTSPDEQLQLCQAEGLACTIGKPYIDTQNGQCSSSAIREKISNGAVDVAAEMLGRRYTISGTIVHGDGIGHKIGFPTANLKVDQDCKLIPSDGVYAAMVDFDGQMRPAVIDIGIRPTIEGKEHRIEAHIINFSAKIYGRKMTICFFSRIRDEKRFSMLEELEKQIVNDIDLATKILCQYSQN